MTKEIHNPALIDIKQINDNCSTFVIEPLHSGYGNTLGNSLRRVLLSSIKGAAITSFKIEGATHEFTTIPGIKEDVVDIALNLKNVRFILHTDEPVELRLEKSGSGEIKAGDIKLTADAEIVNPDQLIATIDNPKGKFVMDLVVEAGRGYQTIDESDKNRLHSDHIAIDAIFSPVLRVRFNVESTRVGQETDLQRLLLTVETDGTISPKDAFEEAAAILINQYTALAGSTRVKAAPTLVPKKSEDKNELNTPIEELNLSARTANALVNNNIKTVRDLVSLNDPDLRDLKGFGSKALDEVKSKLAELEL